MSQISSIDKYGQNYNININGQDINHPVNRIFGNSDNSKSGGDGHALKQIDNYALLNNNGNVSNNRLWLKNRRFLQTWIQKQKNMIIEVS